MTSKEERSFTGAMEYIFKAPIVTHPQGTFPSRVYDNHLLHRLAQHDCFEKERCTEFEAMGYISAASLIAPIGRDLTDIYQHLFVKYFSEDAKKMDFEDIEIDEYRMQILYRLQNWIFKKQIQYIKAENKKVKAEQVPESPLGPVIVQQTLDFNLELGPVPEMPP